MADIVDYHFSNPILLKAALEVAGACDQPGGVTDNHEGNKKLALLGDAVIRLLILDGWYEESSSPIHDESQRMALDTGSQMVASSASNTALGQLAHRHGLEKYVTKNPCQRGDVSDYTLASTVEALVGAVWIDCHKDLKTVKGVMDHLNMVKD